MLNLFSTILLAGFLGWLLTWAVRRLAPVLGLVDEPDGWRKLHGRPVSLGGGAAVWLATVVVVAIGLLLDSSLLQNAQVGLELWGLLAGSIVLLVVGLVDDLYGMRGRHKLLGQCLAIACVYFTGLEIGRVEVLGTSFDLGMLAVPFTLFWLLGAINSINLLDGTDGLASTMGIAICGTIAILGHWSGHPIVTLVAGVFAASLIGFLWFNLPPATIYLGDTGSMLIGFVAGTLVLQSSLKAPGTVLLAAPVAIWTIPIFDTGAAILRRKLSGRSLYSTDRGHLHHCLNTRYGNRRTLLVVGVACLITVAGALIGVALRSDLVAVLCSFAVIAMFVSARLFGHVELQLLLARVSRATRTTFGSRKGDEEEPRAWSRSVRLQGTRRWELLWETLTEHAEKYDICELDLNVNLPTLQEGFHATWSRTGRSQQGEDSQWFVRVPLMVGNQVAATVGIAGDIDREGAATDISRVIELLQPFEDQLRQIALEGSDQEVDVVPMESSELASA